MMLSILLTAPLMPPWWLIAGAIALVVLVVLPTFAGNDYFANQVTTLLFIILGMAGTAAYLLGHYHFGWW